MTQHTYNDLFDVFDNYAPLLKSVEVRQLKQANSPDCHLINNIIRPMLYNEDSVIVLADGKKTKRYSYLAQKIANEPDNSGLMDVQYFTNLLLNVPNAIIKKEDAPKDRMAFAPYVMLTIEFDSEDVNFFKQQLAWMRGGKKLTDDPIGQFLTHIRMTFSDCVGLNVTYSGSKSFHFHFVFSTEHIGGQPITSLREGLAAAWERLEAEVLSSPILNVPAHIPPDRSLRFCESYRRCPLGVRTIDGGNIFGLQAGTKVPQCVTWEHFPSRAPKGTSHQSIFDIADFLKIPSKSTVKQNRKGKPTGHALNDTDNHAFLNAKMQDIFPFGVYPSFSHFEQESNGNLSAFFFNSPTDNTASSIMKSEFRTVLIQGKPIDGDPKITLPKSLNEMIQDWNAEYDALTYTVERERTVEEQKFADVSTSKSAAIKAIGTILTDAMHKHGKHWICAPEGISKSRSLFAATETEANYRFAQNITGTVMYAFDTYEMATQKCKEFQRYLKENSKSPMRELAPIMLTSFTRVYAEICQQNEIAELTTEYAVNNGHASLIEAIKSDQPDVLKAINRYYQEKRVRVSNRIPVIFTVHEVAQGWYKNPRTRRMFSAAYWSDDQTNVFNRCREDTKIGILIHDEVAATDLITMTPMETVEWIKLLHRDTSAWASSTGALVDRYQSYQAVKRYAPTKLTFADALRLSAVKEWDDTVTTAYNNEYDEPREGDIYAAVAGNDWNIKKAEWFNTAATTIVLTTESVPTIIARKFSDDWNVIELDTPHIARDSVTTNVYDRLTSDKLVTVVTDESAKFKAKTGKELLCISNKAKGVLNTTTHKTAKGSNHYIGKPVLQTMTLVPPPQYEVGEVLNAYVDRTDMVMLAHLDEFNQTAGRNLGFRLQTGAEHHLVINRALYMHLARTVLAQARYQMKPIISKRDRLTEKKALTALRNKLTQTHKYA